MTLERRVWLVARLAAALLVLVSLRAAYWQVWRGRALDPVVLDPAAAAQVYADLRGAPVPEPAGDLSALPQPVIQRTVQMLSTVRRGTIYDRAGNVLAEDRGAPGAYTRYYSEASLAHVVGYTSALRTGINGLEAAYNESLLGFDRADTQIDRMLHRPSQGSDLLLTIDPQIQRAAEEGLAGRPGAVVVLDGRSGAVLALTSAPTFDPNRLTEDGYLGALGQGALLNRATQGLYTPGSVWKTVTMIAALDTGQVKPDTVFDFGEPRVREDGSIYYVYSVDGGEIPDGTHKQRTLDLTAAYAYSANAAFARLADEMDPEVFIDYGARLGFSDPDYARRFPMELPTALSLLANDVDSIRSSNLMRASDGFGQGELLTTPIQMAIVVEAVLNGGSVPVPYLVQTVRDPQGRVLSEQPNHHVTGGTMRAETAQQVKAIMTSCVQNFFGGENFLGIPGVAVGFKTGTAQLGGDLQPHGWMIGFAEQGERSVVVVVLLENGGGASKALPVFQQVTRAAVQAYLTPQER